MMMKINMYGCQAVMGCSVVALYYVNLAKLKLCFTEFSSLHGSRLSLATREICIKFERQTGSCGPFIMLRRLL